MINTTNISDFYEESYPTKLKTIVLSRVQFLHFIAKNEEDFDKLEILFHAFLMLQNENGFSINGCGCCGSPALQLSNSNLFIEHFEIKNKEISFEIVFDDDENTVRYPLKYNTKVGFSGGSAFI